MARHLEILRHGQTGTIGHSQYDDSGGSGAARLGCGDRRVHHCQYWTNASTTHHNLFRDSFVVPGDVIFTNLNFRSRGWTAVYAQRQEAFRTNMPTGRSLHDRRRCGRLSRPRRTLLPTTSRCRVCPRNKPGRGGSYLYNASRNSLGFDMELIARLLSHLSPSVRGRNICLTWPLPTEPATRFILNRPDRAERWTNAAATIRHSGQYVVTYRQTDHEFFVSRNLAAIL